MKFRGILPIIGWLIIPVIFNYGVWETFLTFLAWAFFMITPSIILYKYVSGMVNIDDLKIKKSSMKDLIKSNIVFWSYLITVHLTITSAISIPLSWFFGIICICLWIDYFKKALDID